MTFKVADYCDQFPDKVQVLEPMFQHYGGVRQFHGVISTLKVLHDIALVRQTLSTPGQGHVLVVDGGGSLKRALMGDQFSAKAIANGWAGVVVYGAIRDSLELSTMNIGVKALGLCPMRGENTGAGHRDVPLRFAGATFQPGYYLYADSDGIIVTQHPLHTP